MLEKIQGAYWGAALGSTLAKATQNKARETIRQQYGKVTDFFPAAQDAPGAGLAANQTGGEFGNVLYLTKHILKENAPLSEGLAFNALQEWEGCTHSCFRFADPTSQYIISGKETQNRLVRRMLWKGSYFCLSTNGIAIKAFPLGLLSGGNVDQAIANTCSICLPEYRDIYSLQAGCSVAAAVSRAMQPNATMTDIVQAGFYGVKEAEHMARTIGCREYPGPSVEMRMEMAVEIALKHADPEKALDELAAVIGNCCMAAESIPAVFGILAVSGGDTMAAIFNAVNLGNDSAGAAVMTGAIMGAKNGISALDERLRMQLVIPEPFDLDLLSAEMKERAENQ